MRKEKSMMSWSVGARGTKYKVTRGILCTCQAGLRQVTGLKLWKNKVMSPGPGAAASALA